MFTVPPPCPVAAYLAKTLKDPDSFKLDKCEVSAGPTAWIADCVFRARNSFGGVNREHWRFMMKGNVLLDAKKIQ